MPHTQEWLLCFRRQHKKPFHDGSHMVHAFSQFPLKQNTRESPSKCCYSPTNAADDLIKKQFYQRLQMVLDEIKEHNDVPEKQDR